MALYAALLPGEPGNWLLTSREERGDIGGMTGTAGTAWAWVVLWIVLVVALLVTGSEPATWHASNSA